LPIKWISATRHQLIVKSYCNSTNPTGLVHISQVSKHRLASKDDILLVVISIVIFRNPTTFGKGSGGWGGSVREGD
jgi:hypothetical protein